jgi:rubredoxin
MQCLWAIKTDLWTLTRNIVICLIAQKHFMSAHKKFFCEYFGRIIMCFMGQRMGEKGSLGLFKRNWKCNVCERSKQIYERSQSILLSVWSLRNTLWALIRSLFCEYFERIIMCFMGHRIREKDSLGLFKRNWKCNVCERSKQICERSQEILVSMWSLRNNWWALIRNIFANIVKGL